MFIKRYGKTDFITGLRALAIFLVFLVHSGGFGIREWGALGNNFVSSGKYGVQIFFVISGFTIFYQMIDRKTPILLFLKLRISRISIPYYPLLILVFLYINMGGYQFNSWADKFNDGSITFLNLLSHMIYVSPYSINWQNTILGVEWTLGIEIFYYIVFGILISANVIQNSRKSQIFFGIFALFISGLSVLAYHYLDLERLYFNWLPIKYLYMFYLGTLAYSLRKEYNAIKLNYKIRKFISDTVLIISLVIYFFLLFLDARINIDSMFLENYFIFGTFFIIILYSEDGFLSKILVSPLFLFFGTISYSFYLIHYPLILILPKYIHWKILSHPIIILLLSTGFSTIWYYAFENSLYLGFKKKIT